MSTMTSAARTNSSLPATTRRKVKWGDLTLATVSHLLLIVLSLIAILPLAWAVSSAFKSNSEILTGLSFFPQQPTFEHFHFVLDQTNFPQWLSIR